MNAYEGKAGMVYLQVELSDPCLTALRYTIVYKRRYINNLPFLSFPPAADSRSVCDG